MIRKEYQGILKNCSLTAEQVQAMGDVIDGSFPGGRGEFIDGWTEGMNSVYRFIGGDMESHDEFEDERYPVTLDHNALVAQASSMVEAPFSAFAELIKPCAIEVATQLKEILNEEQRRAFSAAMKDLAAPRLSALIRFLDKRKLDGLWPEGYFGARGVWWVEFINNLEGE